MGFRGGADDGNLGALGLFIVLIMYRPMPHSVTNGTHYSDTLTGAVDYRLSLAVRSLR